MQKFFLLFILILSLTTFNLSHADGMNVTVSNFKGKGGRVDWSPTGKFAVFDRKGWDGGHDIYLTRDFKTEKCLTCKHPDLPNQKRKYGQPAVHPSGRYIVFQAEKQKHGFVIPIVTNPGAGVFNDIWLYDLQTGRAKPLWEVPNTKEHGVLHPQFSRDGKKISWSELYKTIDFRYPGTGAGSWVLKVADFTPNGLKNIKQYQPGEEVIFENHGFSHDGEWLFFSSNMKLKQPVNTGTDIYKIHLKSRKLVRLTNKGYNEHAHLSPDGKYIVWMSSVGNGDTYDFYQVGTDYWVMNADGSNKQRLTHFNKPGHPHFRGRYVIVADFAWDPASSTKNGYRIFAYLFEMVTKNIGLPPVTRGARGEYTFFVTFKPKTKK